MARSDLLGGGFLELARYGVRSPDSPHASDILAELDDTSRIRFKKRPACYERSSFSWIASQTKAFRLLSPEAMTTAL